MNARLLSFGILLTLLVGACSSSTPKNESHKSTSKWIRPSQDEGSIPVWGLKEGIRMGIAPTQGPRGLIRVYATYLGLDELKMINFIALEPIKQGDTLRGFSELEHSELDNIRGKRFWSANDSLAYEPRGESDHAKGIIREVDGVEVLTLFIHCEAFNNGAKVYVKAEIAEDKPFEIELTTYTRPDSAPLDHFILTATMGNFARLRKLYLKEGVKTSLNTWPRYTDIHFASHDSVSSKEMVSDTHGNVYFIAYPDEANPAEADYDPSTNAHWKYYGRKATQYWKVRGPSVDTYGLVNGRYVYWASQSKIPGGISYENVEIKAPYMQGAKFTFGVTPQTPEELISTINQ